MNFAGSTRILAAVNTGWIIPAGCAPLDLACRLSLDEMDRFYKLLDLRSLEHPRGDNILHALKWSPVIATSVEETKGHAMVIDGHLGPNYTIINPCAQMVANFDNENNDSCTVGRTPMKRTEFDRKLGKLIWYW
jgi:hypothetical protein